MRRLLLALLLVLVAPASAHAGSRFSGLHDSGDCVKPHPDGVDNYGCVTNGDGRDDEIFPILKDIIELYDYRCPSKIRAYHVAESPRGKVYIAQCGFNEAFRYRIEIWEGSNRFIVTPTSLKSAYDAVR
jgi:hypothetical protein